MNYFLQPLVTLILLNTVSYTYTMRVPTGNQRFLQAIKAEPQEIQSIIAHSMAQEFFLVAKTLARHSSPIQSIALHGDVVKIQLHHDEEGSCSIEETWNRRTNTLLTQIEGPYTININRTLIINTGIAHGPSFFSMPTPMPQFNSVLKKKVQRIHRTIHTTYENLYTNMEKSLSHLTVPQADLIRRAYDATKQGAMFTIFALSEDGKVFLTFTKNTRMYLLDCLNIQLQVEPWYSALGNCVIQ